MFEGFRLSTIDTAQASIRVRHGGSGPPLLLLHGSPQTHVMWHEVAPRLAEDFTVIATDLRGYGDSSKPESAPDHEPYSKRTMALDQIEVMTHFGFERFALCGHHLVMGPAARGASVRFRVLIDGQPPGAAHGIDVDDQGNGTVSEQRLYQLIRQPKPIADRHFEIEFLDPGVEAYCFTFG